MLYERNGDQIAHVKFTVLLQSGGTTKITGLPMPDGIQVQCPQLLSLLLCFVARTFVTCCNCSHFFSFHLRRCRIRNSHQNIQDARIRISTYTYMRTITHSLTLHSSLYSPLSPTPYPIPIRSPIPRTHAHPSTLTPSLLDVPHPTLALLALKHTHAFYNL